MNCYLVLAHSIDYEPDWGFVEAETPGQALDWWCGKSQFYERDEAIVAEVRIAPSEVSYETI